MVKRLGVDVDVPTGVAPSRDGHAAKGAAKVRRSALLVRAVLVGLTGVICLSSCVSQAILKGRAKRAMAELRSVATACQAFAVDFKGFPKQEKLGPVSGIQEQLCPDYIRSLTTSDYPRGDFLYLSSGDVPAKMETGILKHVGAEFLLIWPGEDGRLDPETQELLRPGPDGKMKIWTMRPKKGANYDCDIVWIGDAFRQDPFLEEGPASAEAVQAGNVTPPNAPPAVSVQPGTPEKLPSAPRAGDNHLNIRDGLQYVWIPPGAFRMGCAAGDGECFEDENPAHQIRISRGFWMGGTEVPVAAFLRFVQATGYITEGEKSRGLPNWRNPGFPQSASQPVVLVTWLDAANYCAWAGGRLPTEAEWEYAARATSDKRYPWGNEMDGACAWYAENSRHQPHPVGQSRPNAWGLYDMVGNVWEICADFYSETYYAQSPGRDPAGPAPNTGEVYVVRGGSWRSVPRGLRASFRYDFGYRSDDHGFRCVLRAP